MNGRIQAAAVVMLCAVIGHGGIVSATTLEGKVFEGDMGDESKPIRGVTVALYGSNDSGQLGSSITSTTTNSSGWYGLEVQSGYEYYHIVETNPEKYTSVGATTVSGSVIDSDWIQYAYPLGGKTLTGNKFWDKKEGGQPPENHPPVADADGPYTGQVGQPITLDGSASYDPDPGDSIISYEWDLDGDGQYDDASGATVQHTWNAPFSGSIGLKVTDQAGETGTDTAQVQIEEQPSKAGAIQGVKFNDLNNDGIWNGTETGMSGWTIFLDTEPYNAQLDPGEASDVTNQSGSYCFPGLAPGIYHVHEMAQAGWQITWPPSGFYAITMQTNEVYELQNFGNHYEGEESLQACCLPDGSCANLTPEQCRQHGGTPQGQGTVCAGDTCGGQPPEGDRYDLQELCFVLDLDVPGVGRSNVAVTGNGTMEVQFEGPAPGTALDHDGNGRDELAAELVSLSLIGMDPLLGQVRVGLNPAFTSNGELEELVNTTPGILDLPPFTAAGQVDSFFDVFIEIDLPDLGLTLRADQAKHIQGVLDRLPALQPIYTEPSSTTVPLLRQPDGTHAGTLGPLIPCQAGYRRDYGDAPAPYPDASHTPGLVWLGFAAPDTEAGTQPSPLADGDDMHGFDDEDGAWFTADVVPGQFTWLALALSGLNQDLTFAVWIDYNGNGNWEHPAELYSSGNGVTLSGSPLGLIIANPIPANARIGTTCMRVRVYPGLNAPVSPTGDAQGGEVEDYQVEIKRAGVIVSPGHVIAGIKFNDLDGDGAWDPADGELLLSNWTIWLDIDNDGTPDRTTTTDTLGGFEFTGLNPGTYTVGEQQQSGWTQTVPAGGTTYTVTIPGGLQPTIAFATFGNQRTQEDRDLDFGDAPDTYRTLLAGGGAWHKAGPLTLGASVDIEADGVPSLDATGDDLAGNDDEDGLISSLGLTTGKIATISLIVANSDAAGDSGMVAGWIDFDGNGQFDLVSDDIGTQYVSVPGGGQSIVQFTFLVPAGAKAGRTYARFRLYRDDPNPLAIPWAILPTGPADYGEVEDYTATIRNGISADGRDYGDAPLPYPEASHPLGGPYLGLFGDLPDKDTGMQRDAAALGDDSDADGDDENGLLSVNLVETPGVWSHAEMKMWTSSTGVLTGAIWIDWNADGDWDDAGELVGSASLSATPVPPGGAWIRVMWGFPLPGVAKPGNTFARLRVCEGFSVPLTPNGAGGAGEVEDHLVQIKAGGPGLPPGGIVHGYKWNDQDGDGAWDAAEPGLAGWTIWLDLNGSGADDAGDRYETTDGNGYFQFTGVPGGTYLVGEKAQTGWTRTCPSSPGTYTETVTPGWASVALLFANTRRPIQPPLDKLKFDWGDAPDPTYPTLRAANGAYHVITPGFQLGGAVDAELDGQASPDAMGDDHFGVDDEDGVVFLTPVLPGQTMMLDVMASAVGKLDAWIDFDVDGTWTQATDQILKGASLTAGSNVLTVAVPAGARVGAPTFARFRFSSAGNLPYDGPGQGGEVEDYAVWLGEGGPLIPGQRPAHAKWSQPPIEIDPNLAPNVRPVFCGWNQPSESSVLEDQRRVWQIALDDFHCLGPIPVTRLRWWGSYEGWDRLELPATLPEAWQITFWVNRLENVDVVPFAEKPAWCLDIPSERVHVQPAGTSQFPQQSAETCFMYELLLDPNEWFWQSEFPSEQNVYWIGIAAVYPPGAADEEHWGWMTRPEPWRDPAQIVVLHGEGPNASTQLERGMLQPGVNSLLCDRERGYDMTFDLLTEQPWIHWDQPFVGIRAWPDAVDTEALAVRYEEDRIQVQRQVADDWSCERPTPIVAVSWHGSYIGYVYDLRACESAPKPRRPDAFALSIWTQAASDAQIDHPGEQVWQFITDGYDEIVVGYDKNPRREDPNEPVYRYSVVLPEDRWFRPVPGQIYWFSVTPVYNDLVSPVAYPWGWTTRRHEFETGANRIDYPPATRPQWRLLLDPLDRPFDMCFTLFTKPE